METTRLDGYRKILVGCGAAGEMEEVGESKNVVYRSGYHEGHAALPRSEVHFSTSGAPNDALRKLIDLVDERRRNLPVGGLVKQDAPKFTLRIVGREGGVEFREVRFEFTEKGRDTKYHDVSVKAFSESLPTNVHEESR